jgi:FAD/FMN-containing dehydrogenase
MKISGWGKYPIIESKINYLRDCENIKSLIKNKISFIPFGLGRSYGDAALFDNVVKTSRFARILSFDEESGLLEAEAGLSLGEILEIFVPRGWFLPVTPGTKFVTLGGAIASDVHGKNHHKEGTFCEHIQKLKILKPDGQTAICSKSRNKELFFATCGGNGLTGLILSATLRLKKIQTSYIVETKVKCENIDKVLDAFERYEQSTYSVAWIDCVTTGNSLGRSILMVGEHAEKEQLPSFNKKKPLLVHKKGKLNIPFNLPSFTLNPFTIKAFNSFYYYCGKEGVTNSIVHYDSFFYPLDSINNWNRIYGKKGFLQYQFVVPKNGGKIAIKDILNRIAQNGTGSFLAVLKAFGKENENYLSFPMEGYTLALDFKISDKLFPFLKILDKVVLSYGGRLYLTKDVRMSKETFYKSYKNAEKFVDLKNLIDKDRVFQSIQSNRLEI